jgi:oxygen-independent coproporphyrinogen-3 oxidase
MRLPVYVHVPFCRSKCPYCAFTSAALDGEPPLLYVAAILAEAETRLTGLTGEVTVPSVYFGGGTPSLLAPERIAHILAAIANAASLSADAEITLEANPGTINAERLAGYRGAGVNRMSIGCQSFDDDMLKKLGRIHTAAESVMACRDARAAGFDNISVDLMFGAPAQTLDLWRDTIQRAVDLEPEHISLYCLTIEPDTPFAERHNQGGLFADESDVAREEREACMFEAAMDHLPAAGYAHYEIANFAQPGRRCAHNLAYWRNEPYIGLGPAAHSYLPTAAPPLCERSANTSDIEEYTALARRRGVATASRERLAPAKAVGESIMLGLRLIDGVDLRKIAQRWGLDPRERFAAEIERLASKGMIEERGGSIRLTRRGILLADEVMQLFV